MKPLVGKRRGDFFYYLRRADEYLFRARELSVKAYGSHMVTSEIDRARFITSFGFSQFRSRGAQADVAANPAAGHAQGQANESGVEL